MKYVHTPVVEERKEFLMRESEYILRQIAKLHPQYESAPIELIAKYLGDPDVIATAIEKKIMSAPGIVNVRYRGDFITKPQKYGMINAVKDYLTGTILTERERLSTSIIL